MPRYRPEPPRPPDAHRDGVLLVNLGSPKAPTASALRPWLKQFLSDPRIVELPRLLWYPILALILATRPARSAKKYASIWMPEGSPLTVHTKNLALAVQAELADISVEWAMRYGTPSIEERLEQLRAAGCERILVVPLYPQYAASTTASTLDEVTRIMQTWRAVPEIRYVRSFPTDAGYIAVLAKSVEEHQAEHGVPDYLVMSFHGQPKKTDALGDPYRSECLLTAQALANKLGLTPDQYKVTFQSRFGPADWLQPYTQASIETLAAAGAKHIDIICPGFTADCLETLEEIGILAREAFLAHGGERFHVIECLNSRSEWVQAVVGVIGRHSG